MDKEINITYETLFELLRRERSREELQELSQTFFDDLVDYIKSKKQILQSKMAERDVYDQQKKIEMQLQNINKILKELYEKRERKIINMSLSKSRTGSDIIDTSKLLEQEKEMYDELKQVFDSYRKKILFNILSARLPGAVPDKQQPGTMTIQQGKDENKHEEKQKKSKDALHEDKEKVPEREMTEKEETEKKEEPGKDKDAKSTVLVRFLQPVPKFIGRELETYGPFDSEDMVTLPAEIAEILIKKERAEEIAQ